MWQWLLLFFMKLWCLPKAETGETLTESFKLPNNYTKGNDGHHYKYVSDGARWIDASKICNNEGAQLAIDDSLVVHNYLINTYSSQQYWIGVNELAVQGTWRYNDGRKVKRLLRFWDSGQPGNDKKNDDCVAMFESGRWHDAACTLEKPFLCQIKEVPDGYTKGLDGHYYKYFTNKTNWNDANTTCNNEGAQLAIDDSDIIHKYLINTYPSLQYWIGVNDLVAVGTWRYNDGRKVKKGYWDFGQPGNDGEGDCVAMWKFARWRVDVCTVERPFLCQITVGGEHLVELMSERIDNNGFTAPVIMGVIILLIFLFIIWCYVKHRKSRGKPRPTRNKSNRNFQSSQSSNQQPRFVINLNDTITINPQGTKPISTIHKSVVFASSTTAVPLQRVYPASFPEDGLTLPQVFSNSGYMHGQEPPPSYYSVTKT